MLDAIVIGGGPAGLQATLTLGRMHRPTLMLDSGAYRNAPVDAMHNIITNDGRAPAEFRSIVRGELAAYAEVEVRDVAATTVVRLDDGTFEVTLADGSVETSRAVVLATGLRDVMPDIDGFAEQWGRTVHVCPFCHGHELHGKRIAIQDSPAAEHQVPLLSPIVGSIAVVPAVTSVELTSDGLVVTSGDSSVVVDGLFAHPAFEQSAPFAAQLGLEMRDSGCIAIDLFGATSVPGVFAAGDLAHVAELPMPMPSVLAAAAAGQLAGAAVVRSSVMQTA
ncbi:NAD(P)/FAD-dependent oxidoreductase [Nocardioides currus]|uniref:NAD(P)/FAD-dependent oxidoreductase n=1 Tax=Nocardioides currus TaxID=2133958 RepID=A0A2R7YWH3_9ACTN|nr:NAD(P)/FAD-dependent oxidoreductase [Nocardioides currus]PUA80406.1 NAD(P)/FAD-dependent oxidoreductase [Nocardioides currus]